MVTNESTVACKIIAGDSSCYKWILALIMMAVIALGWKFPFLGFAVPAAMGAGIVGAFFRGRWVCGNACPRGSFLDSWFRMVSGDRQVPAWLKSPAVRWAVLGLLMGFMVYRLSLNPGDPEHWGRVFWQMCLVTTVAAVVLGIGYSARSWCMICPVGTLAGEIGRKRYPLQIDESCLSCGLCEKSCPMQLAIVSHRETGKLVEKDCIKCSNCLSSCQQNNVLSWPLANKAR